MSTTTKQTTVELWHYTCPDCGMDRVPTRGVATALLSRVSCSIRLPMLAG